MAMKLITININENVLEYIDQAAVKDKRSRSNFMEVAAAKAAHKILGVK